MPSRSAAGSLALASDMAAGRLFADAAQLLETHEAATLLNESGVEESPLSARQLRPASLRQLNQPADSSARGESLRHHSLPQLKPLSHRSLELHQLSQAIASTMTRVESPLASGRRRRKDSAGDRETQRATRVNWNGSSSELTIHLV